MPCGSVTIKKQNQKGRMLSNNCVLAMRRFVWNTTLFLFLMSLWAIKDGVDQSHWKTQDFLMSLHSMFSFSCIVLNTPGHSGLMSNCEVVQPSSSSCFSSSVLWQERQPHYTACDLPVLQLSLNCREADTNCFQMFPRCAMSLPSYHQNQLWMYPCMQNCECFLALEATGLLWPDVTLKI